MSCRLDLKADPTLKPSALSGSLVTNGNVSATEWTFSSDSWDTVITINNVDDVINTDNILTDVEEFRALNDTKICIWNQDREDPIEVYEDEAVSPGVDYSISLG